ncbi:glucose-1-phosphate adenylyltransferase [Thiohalomonas denitrificans]|uniref:Glucose-1-phosphate adenylyltransferase n=1 Tax=Thiohalomonas denitrificans TaxID=415747 RepID=A0A1G5Q2G9_9GAMM|nr:glucose-1-phosphate adenylyltransferase [Thiohalomonas denitrificans]SCZ55650.1 glucose-1-phosphate adenylyltransferase [Thiohalomonas denitrificans]
MSTTAKVLAIVLAGGEGSRLSPLTQERSKPSVPFGGRYRIVDFVLSNFINSHVYSIYLLVQYKSQSLIEHVRKGWGLSPQITGHFVTVVPPQMRGGADWFQGTSDAVYQNLNLIHKHRPDLVAVFGADHIYRMDLRPMISFHQKMRADVSVASLPVPLTEVSAFGIIETDEKGRISRFQEKPETAKPMPGNKNRAFASMGNYLFNRDALVDALEEAHRRGEKDFGKDVIPRLLGDKDVYAYDFSSNQVPGVKAYEEHAYWRDVGSIRAYWHAHQDLLGSQPRFDLFNPFWPIRSSHYDGPTARIITGRVEDSSIGAGAIIFGGHIKKSIVRREVVIEDDVELEGCIIMDYVMIKRGSRLRNVIVDRYNIIDENTQIGFDRKADEANYYVDEASDLVVVSKGRRHLDPVY